MIAGGVELSSYPARCVLGARAPHAAGRDRGRRRGRARGAARPLPRRGPELEPQPHAARARAVRDRRRTRRSSRRCVRRGGRGAPAPPRSAARATGPTRRSSPPPGIPTVMFGPGGEGAHADEEWVSLARHVAVAATLLARRRSALRVSGAASTPPCDPAAVPAPSARRARVPRRADRATRRRRCASCRAGRRARPRRRRGQGRVRPPRAARVQGARRVVGDRARAARATRTSHTLVAASAGNHGRAVAHVAARRGLRCRVFLPARAVAGAPRRRSPARAPRSSSSTAPTRRPWRAPRPTGAAAGRRSRSPTSATAGPRALGDRRLRDAVRRARRAGALDVVLVPVGVGSLGRGRRALRRAARGAAASSASSR